MICTHRCDSGLICNIEASGSSRSRVTLLKCLLPSYLSFLLHLGMLKSLLLLLLQLVPDYLSCLVLSCLSPTPRSVAELLSQTFWHSPPTIDIKLPHTPQHPPTSGDVRLSLSILQTLQLSSTPIQQGRSKHI